MKKIFIGMALLSSLSSFAVDVCIVQKPSFPARDKNFIECSTVNNGTRAGSSEETSVILARLMGEGYKLIASTTESSGNRVQYLLKKD